MYQLILCRYLTIKVSKKWFFPIWHLKLIFSREMFGKEEGWRTIVPVIRNPRPVRPSAERLQPTTFPMASLIARSVARTARRGVQVTSVRCANKSKCWGGAGWDITGLAGETAPADPKVGDGFLLFLFSPPWSLASWPSGLINLSFSGGTLFSFT